jgi:Sulfatase
MEPGRRAWRWASVLLAVVFLNAAVSFHNVWPTLGIRWPGEISVELAALVVVLAISNTWFGATPRRVLAGLSVLVVALALGRYGEVTAPALYGREVNLYWDLPNVASVAGMLTRVASAWLVAALSLCAVLLLAALYLLARWSLRRIDEALRTRAARWGFGAAGALLVACFAVQQISDDIPRLPRFSIPVSKTYAVQLARVLDTFSSSRAVQRLPPSPPMHSDLSALAGGDVLVVFMESYGSVTYDRPEFLHTLAPVRERLAAAIRDTGRGVASAFVSSPTFGGSSWLAHISLLSGIEVRDPNRYALLMTQKRQTLPSLFKSAGYRTIAVMPGLHQTWPEGAFYDFDRVYNLADLDYHGPEFGWWRIPDQFSLAALDSREMHAPARKPLFVFFPTVSTHMPFRPTPPLQPDWRRLLSPHPFDAEPLQRSLAQAPDWTDMGKSYASSVQYFLDTVASYLRARADDSFVMIILGDHQPAANVSGEGASWDVPVHVIARQGRVLQSLQASGFQAGLTPGRPAAGKMNELDPLLLAAFDGSTPALRKTASR